MTVTTYLRRLRWYEVIYHFSPMQLVGMGEAEQYKAILTLVSDLSAKDHAGSNTESMVKALKSWLAFNGKTVTRSLLHFYYGLRCVFNGYTFSVGVEHASLDTILV